MQTATLRKSVLIVDDEPLFLSSVREGLSHRRRDLDILGATQGQEALDLLRSRPVDLVVTDLQMPVLDGFGLISHMLNERMGTPVIVMTAFGTPEMEDSVRRLGAVAYVEKPIDLKALDATIDRELRRAAKGHIQGITLFGFLQLLQLERKTCTLRVTSGENAGQLCFQDGEMMHAEIGATTGPEAVYLLEGWAAPEIEIEHVCRARERTVFASMTELLLEGARRADEEKRGADAPNDEELLDAAWAWDTQDLQPVLDQLKGPAPSPWDGRPAASWWNEARTLLGDDGLPSCAIAVRLSDGAAVALRGSDDLCEGSQPIVALIANACAAAGENGRGSFEWVDGHTGIGILWETASDAALAVAEELAGRRSAPWFRSQFSAVVRRATETVSQPKE